ncbi:hypothetical protein COE25_26185 [Bacillus sp. AFS031507]|nr:hypothetical protein COE25_26185 [Bacillus sp. AFS031507]
MANLSILKWESKSGSFFNIRSICKTLDCQPGDILAYKSDEDTY